MSGDNIKNSFVLDAIPDDDIDLQQLRDMQKIKQEISKKKKDLKRKNFDRKHPRIADLKKEMGKKNVRVDQPFVPIEEAKKNEAEKIDADHALADPEVPSDPGPVTPPAPVVPPTPSPAPATVRATRNGRWF